MAYDPYQFTNRMLGSQGGNGFSFGRPKDQSQNDFYGKQRKFWQNRGFNTNRPFFDPSQGSIQGFAPQTGNIQSRAMEIARNMPQRGIGYGTVHQGGGGGYRMASNPLDSTTVDPAKGYTGMAAGGILPNTEDISGNTGNSGRGGIYDAARGFAGNTGTSSRGGIYDVTRDITGDLSGASDPRQGYTAYRAPETQELGYTRSPFEQAAEEQFKQNIGYGQEALYGNFQNIANHGLYNAEGREAILGPIEERERQFAQGLLQFQDSQNEAARQSLQDQIGYRQAQGAEQRRRASLGLGSALGGRVATQPGMAMKALAEAGSTSQGQQASDIFGAQQGQSLEERQRAANTFNTVGQLGLDSAERRAQLLQEDMGKNKLLGLQLAQGQLQIQENFLRSGGFDFTDPQLKAFNFQTLLNQQGADLQRNRDYLQQEFRQFNDQNQAYFTQMLQQQNDPEFMDYLADAFPSLLTLIPGYGPTAAAGAKVAKEVTEK